MSTICGKHRLVPWCTHTSWSSCRQLHLTLWYHPTEIHWFLLVLNEFLLVLNGYHQPYAAYCLLGNAQSIEVVFIWLQRWRVSSKVYCGRLSQNPSWNQGTCHLFLSPRLVHWRCHQSGGDVLDNPANHEIDTDCSFRKWFCSRKGVILDFKTLRNTLMIRELSEIEQ